MKLITLIKEKYNGIEVNNKPKSLLTQEDFVKVFEKPEDAIELTLVQRYADEHDMDIDSIIKMIIKEEGYIMFNARLYLPTLGQLPLRMRMNDKKVLQFYIAPTRMLGTKNFKTSIAVSGGGVSQLYMSREIWKKVNGAIPKDKVIRLIDGNPYNWRLDNMELISRNEASRKTISKTLIKGLAAQKELQEKNEEINKLKKELEIARQKLQANV